MFENRNLDNLQGHIIELKNYCMALRKRLVLIKENYAIKTENEKNEIDILIYETEEKIRIVKHRVKKLELTFSYKLNSFINEIKETENEKSILMPYSTQ